MVVFLGFSFCPIHFRLSTGEANNPETNGYKQKEKMEEEEEKGGKEGEDQLVIVLTEKTKAG